jgi:hypothetical protein
MRIASVIIISVLAVFGCNRMNLKRINGDGHAAIETRQAHGFRSVEVTGPFKVFVKQGETYSVEVRSDENLLKYIETESDGDELRIRPRRGYNLRPRTTIEIFIVSPKYEQLSVTGTGRIESSNQLTASRISAEIAGSGNILLDVDAPEIATEITGSGNIVLKGRTRDLNSEINGSGELHAFDLLSENTSVEISGSGDADVFASKNLDVQIAGAGNINYKGNPAVKRSVAGSGNIRKAD